MVLRCESTDDKCRVIWNKVVDHYNIVAAADPQQIFETLKETYSLRLKGVEPLRYHLGCNFFRDPDGTLCQSAEQYVERMHANYTRLS